MQHIVFGHSDTVRHEKIKENILPVTVLASFVLASIGVPLLPQWAGPLAVAQARRAQPDGDVISETSQTPKPTRSQTVTVGTSKSSRHQKGNRSTSSSFPDDLRSPAEPKSPPAAVTRTSSVGSSPKDAPDSKSARKPAYIDSKLLDARLSSSSLPLPDIRTPGRVTQPATPMSAVFPRPGDNLSRRHSHHVKTLLNQSEMTSTQKARLLRQNYFRCQTAFLTALEDISNRLVIVPKQARLSALRAELALIARDLPAELDIPVICPPTLVDGSPSRSRHHRIVRVNPSEATVLNSAEKVPFLLMVEILRDDFTFDPESADNQRLIATLLAEQGIRKRLFDLSEAPRLSTTGRSGDATTPIVDSVFEPTSGDLGSSPMLKPFDDDSANKKNGKLPAQPVRLPSSTATISNMSDMTATPRTSVTSTSRSSSPGISGTLRRMTITNPRTNSAEQPDFSALATHMRTASQMLAQLEATSGKRPRNEVAAIRAKIIASMQSLEEQNFDVEDGQGPTFDLIIARASAANAVAAAAAENPEPEPEPDLEPALMENAGQARMENDAMTGGVQRKGDRDDPSAAVFGEAWQQKKERIRKSSPYGWMKSWDLVSVIVKTGADLRQEAFACQLIQVCDKIWVEAGTPVWVKLMRILVTGESSGLVETITNGVSLHSLKRSLTLATIDSGANPRRRIATLKDHFVKTFGPVDSEPHKAAVDAFKRSLAAYSVISYVIQLKDRHNGNVLVDNEGHIIHIDFGFMLSNSPGSVGFEAAPFKLTHEYVEVLGGVGSEDFDDFKKLCKQAFQGKFSETKQSMAGESTKGLQYTDHEGVALRRSADKIIDLVSMMGRDSKMPCFAVGIAHVTNTLRQRFQLHLSAEEAENFVETDLIGKSLGSYYTRLWVFYFPN